MAVTRREFLESGVGALSVVGVSLFKLPGVNQAAFGAEPKKIAEIPVLWMATGSCTGCSVSLLNSSSPSIQELLLGEVLPGKHISLGFHATVMAGAGDQAIEHLEHVASSNRKGYVLVVDGATASKEDGAYCAIGEHGHDAITGYEHIRDLGRNAMAVLAVGSCSSHGGIPAAKPNPTGALSVGELFEKERITTPYVNIPGCPPHPDWIVGTIASLLLGGLQGLNLDEHHHPKAFYSEYVHDICSLRGDFERGRFAKHFGDKGCLFYLGCKGAVTKSDCPTRKFNSGTSWCCEAGHPCIGCANPDFPFDGSMFNLAFDHALTGQALDENHADADCGDCHTADSPSPAPTCGECHPQDEGVAFPKNRPGKTFPVN